MPEKNYKELIDNLYDGVYYVDTKRNFTYWNKAAERLTGFRSEEIIGRACWDNILDHVDEHGNQLCHGGCPLHKTLMDGKLREADVYLRQKNGMRRSVSVRVAPVRDDDGAIVGAVEVFTDNSSKMAIIQELEQVKNEAYLDPLTGICNRRAISSYLEAKMEEYHERYWSFGICMSDIDDFKRINDSMGHAAGDEALKLVANIISNSSRAFDIVGRWGGEEFICILSNVDEKLLAEISERHRILISKSFVSFENKTIMTTISSGATIVQKTDDIESIIKRADKLLYQSKAAGKNKLTVG